METSPRPYCFILMPFGIKPDANGKSIDFDQVYKRLIAPAIDAAGLEPIRADNEQVGGIIHKPMFERLLLCEYAIADLTIANANVYYELGVRHTFRPFSTILLHAGATRLCFDVAMLRALPYHLSEATASDAGAPDQIDQDKPQIVNWLRLAREHSGQGPNTDSPLFQLLDGFPEKWTGDVAFTESEVFRKQVDYSENVKAALAAARKLATDSLEQGRQAVERVRASLPAIADLEAGVIIDLFLSYRAVKSWKRMIDLVAEIPNELRTTVLVQQELALALNRDGQGDLAEQTLADLIDKRGPSSETYGLLGRVYKDRWEKASLANDVFKAKGFLDSAINAYRSGFETDWRDAYPGVNAVTLMELKPTPDPAQARLLPIVTYAAERRIEAGKPDYWNYATIVELSILSRDQTRAEDAYGKALALNPGKFEAESSSRNLRLIREARARRGEVLTWAKAIEDDLAGRA